MEYPIVNLILKRMRSPLILLILAYTISIVGMVLIPGIDNLGNPVNLTIFEAFYFISYVATTIGFGEFPYEFTDTQRLWVVFCIYLTVISWLVAIGNIISLLRDPALKSVWKKQIFVKNVKKINNKFFIICGYGETGERLLDRLLENGHQCVVVDNDPKRINLLDLNSGIYNVPHIRGDVSDVATLKMAGLDNPFCRAILAVTNDDDVNIKVAVVTKVLRSNVKVIYRANLKESILNAKSFDTDHILNTSKLYAERISIGFRAPSIKQILISLLRRKGQPYNEENRIPKGHWVVCGDNEFSTEMTNFLDFEGIDYTLVNNKDNKDGVLGIGTNAVTLRAANINKSVGIVAGTNNDIDNLSIIITARHLNPNLFILAKQNIDSNNILFENADIDSIMVPSKLFVWHAVPLLTQPMLATFLKLVKHQSEEWGAKLLDNLKSISKTVPCTYLINVNTKKSPAICQYLTSGNILRIKELLNSDSKDITLPLMLTRNGVNELLPKLSTAIKDGDIILMASKEKVMKQVLYTISNEQDLYYKINNKEKPVSIVIHYLREYFLNKKRFK